MEEPKWDYEGWRFKNENEDKMLAALDRLPDFKRYLLIIGGRDENNKEDE